jgi:phosphoglycolate phosphatase
MAKGSKNTKQFDLLVFDWDGTLMDSTAVIATSIRAACADLDLPVPSEAEARHIIGLGLNQAIAALQPQLPPDEYPVLAARYRFHFLGNDHALPLFEGVAETIPRLHNAGYWVTVATGKNRHGLDRALDQSGLRKFFHASRCGEESFSKPHPAMLQELMALCDVPPEKTLMIGDTSHDLEMARNAGVQAVAVSYGAHDESTLQEYEPLCVAKSFLELASWLAQHA